MLQGEGVCQQFVSVLLLLLIMLKERVAKNGCHEKHRGLCRAVFTLQLKLCFSPAKCQDSGSHQIFLEVSDGRVTGK